ncbi:hypothetical protein CEXT_803011, partial [Caerostris extrusa]
RIAQTHTQIPVTEVSQYAKVHLIGRKGTQPERVQKNLDFCGSTDSLRLQ